MSYPNYMPPPRLCILRKWPTYAGYGFNLHAEKGKAGQYIGKVDPDSPAELGGLKSKDCLIEVNGTNVEDQSHQRVVEKVKEVSDTVKMLVVEMDTYKFCKENGIVISSDMPEVVVNFTPDAQPTAGDGFSQREIRHEPAPAEQPQSLPQQQHQPPQPSPQHQQQQQQEHQRFESHSAAVAQSQPPQSGNGAATAPVKDPVGNLSLEEMRAKIGSNRRNQAKMNPSSFSEKYSMFQAL